VVPAWLGVADSSPPASSRSARCSASSAGR
jgi:hypothetical protein